MLTPAEAPASARHETRPERSDGIGPLLSYLLLGSGLVLLCVLTATAGEWVSDTWIHSATISEVARRPLAPGHPLVGGNEPFPYFSPYAMVLGWVMRGTGLSSMTTLTMGGLASVVLLLVAWWRLVRAITGARWAPVLALVAMITLWGVTDDMWFWSGFLLLGTFSVGFTWPSVLAAAGGFELWRTALALRTAKRSSVIVTFTLLPGLILLVHPFTAAIAAIAVAVTLARQLRLVPGRVGLAVLCGLGSGALAALWPWIDLRDLLLATHGFDEIHVRLYRDVGAKYALLLLTVPALAWRLRRDRLDPLAWTAILCGSGVALGAATGVWSLGRLIPGVAIPGQLAVAALVADRWSSGSRERTSRTATLAVTAVLLICVAIGAWSQRGALARALPGAELRAHDEAATEAQLPYPDLSFVRHAVRPGDVAIANEWRAARELPTYGLYTVEPQWPSPGLADVQQRTAAERAMFAPATSSQERDHLLASWQVRWIVWLPTSRAQQWPFTGAELVACGPDGAALLRVDPAAGRPSACPR